MAELKELTEQLINKESAKLDEEYRNEQKRVEKELQNEKQKLEEKAQTQKASIESKSKQNLEVLYNTLENNKRDQILAEKQKYIQKVFQDAKEKLEHIDQETFQKFLQKVLNDRQFNKNTRLHLGEKSQAKLTQADLDRLTQNNSFVELSDQYITNEAGFILEQDGVQYNYIFSELVDERKSDIIANVSHELFN